MTSTPSTTHRKRLTAPQKAFLGSYLLDMSAAVVRKAQQAIGGPDDFSRDGEIAVARRKFAQVLEGVSFEGPPLPGHVRVARNLQAQGLLQEVEYAGPLADLRVKFTKEGAHALFELLCEQVCRGPKAV